MQMRWSTLPSLAVVVSLLLLLGAASWSPRPAAVHAQRLLAPLGVPLLPYGSLELDQLAYDPIQQALYGAGMDRRIIVRASEMSSVPLMPMDAAPWSYSLVAGQDGVTGLPGPVEVTSTAATFNGPTGLSGWPQYAVGPTTTTKATPSAAAWVGLWIADCWNHAIRFIHFHRGNNVTLVAGNPNGLGGAQDGVGVGALIGSPYNIAWGRFRRVAVDIRPSASSTTTPADDDRTSVVFWGDRWRNCIRQGIPIHSNNGATYSLMEDVTNASAAATELRDMVLNVSPFAGLCGGNSGNGVGRVVPWRPMFHDPWGVALAGLPTTNTTTVVLFVGDFKNRRLSMIAPMHPSNMRMLTVAYQDTTYDPRRDDNGLTGVTIGRIRHQLAQGAQEGLLVVTMELFVGTYSGRRYLNITLDFMVTATTPPLSSSSRPLTAPNGEEKKSSAETSLPVSVGVSVALYRPATMSVTPSGMGATLHTAMVRYLLPLTTAGSAIGTTATRRESTLVVFSGSNGNVLEFYCCLDGSYSDPIVLEDTATSDFWEAPPPPAATPATTSSVVETSTATIVGITLGIVVGAVALAASVSFLVFYLYRRRPSAAVADHGLHPPHTMSAVNGPDNNHDDPASGKSVVAPSAFVMTTSKTKTLPMYDAGTAVSNANPSLPGGRGQQLTQSSTNASHDDNDNNDGDDSDDDGKCVVCLDKPSQCVCVPCGHQCFCVDPRCHVGAAQGCPICRQPVTSIIKVFMAREQQQQRDDGNEARRRRMTNRSNKE